MSTKTPTARTQRLARLADTQHGVVSRQQLRAIGMGAGAIAYATKGGRLHRVFRNAYAIGHRRSASLDD